MPIEHINKTDTLNEGREKINEAIDGANAADVTSKEADTKATQALANSESTQTQLDTIVIDGDSSVEAAQARVDEKGVPHPTLKARIDDGMNSVNQQLADIAYDMQKLNGTGDVDDSVAIQSIFTQAETGKVKKIVFPKAIYRIDKPIFIDSSDLEIDFSGSTILSNAENNNNDTVAGEYGVLNFRGELQGGRITEYIGNHLSPPSASPVIYSFENDTSSNNIGKITTSNNDYFEIGDEILIRAWTRPEGSPYDKDKFEPHLTIVTDVIDKDDQFIYIDYKSPIKYPEFVDTAGYKSRAHKVNMLKNISVKNVTIIDESPIESDVGRSLSGITAILVDGMNFENITVKSNKYSAISPFFNRNLSVNRLDVKKPRLWGGGQGYAIHVRGTNNFKVENVFGLETRHVVDASFSCYGEFNHVWGIGTKEDDLDVHGFGEHNITFNNCKGRYQLGNNLHSFPNIVSDITFNDCEIVVPGYFNNEHFMDEITFNRCKLSLNLFFIENNVEVNDCEITFGVATNPTRLNKRGLNMSTSCVINNSTIYYNTDKLSGLDFKDVYIGQETLVLNNVEIKHVDANNAPKRGVRFRIFTAKNILITNTNIENTRIDILNTSGYEDIDININSTTLKFLDDEREFISANALKEKNVTLHLSNNSVTHSGGDGGAARNTFYFIDMRADGSEDTFGLITLNNNTLIGTVNYQFSVNFSTSVTSTYVIMRDNDNIIDYPSSASTNKLSTTRNHIID